MFPFDIFGFISGIFILVFVIVIIVFIIVIIIVYKLLHTNVDNDYKSKFKPPKLRVESTGTTIVKLNEGEMTKEKMGSKCKFCGEKIEEDIAYCPFCGSDLSE